MYFIFINEEERNMKLFKSANAVNGTNNSNTYHESDISRKGILIVDDSRFSRNVLKDILIKEKYEVVGEAGDGLEAIEMTKKVHPQYIFMDVEMPKLDGLGAISRILAIDSQIHIIMCTALGQKKIAIEAAKAGAADYITKPYNKDNIINILKMISYSHPNEYKENNNITNINVLKDKIVTDEHGIRVDKALANGINKSNKTQENDIVDSLYNSEIEKLEITDIKQENEENDLYIIDELRTYIDNSENEKINEIQRIVEESEELQKIIDITNVTEDIKDVEESNEIEKIAIEETEETEVTEVIEEKEETEAKEETEITEVTEAKEAKEETEVTEVTEISEAKEETEVTEETEEIETVEPEQFENISKKEAIEEKKEVEEKEKPEEIIMIESSEYLDKKIETLLHDEVVPDINTESIIDKEESNEKSYHLDIEAKTTESELAVYVEDIIDSFAVEIEDIETGIELEGYQKFNDLNTNNCYMDIASDKQNFSYLWNDRFCSEHRNSIFNNMDNQRVAFSYYTNMKNDFDKLFGDDITKKNMMLGMMSAYMPVDNRLQQNEISDFGSDMLRDEEVIRLSADKLLNGYLYNITEFSILDILKDDKSRYKDSGCYNNKKNELSLALGELVNSKASRMFG